METSFPEKAVTAFLFFFFNPRSNDTWGASLVAQRLKHLPPTQETRVQSLGWKGPLEKEMVTHSSILATWNTVIIFQLIERSFSNPAAERRRHSRPPVRHCRQKSGREGTDLKLKMQRVLRAILLAPVAATAQSARIEEIIIFILWLRVITRKTASTMEVLLANSPMLHKPRAPHPRLP